MNYFMKLTLLLKMIIEIHQIFKKTQNPSILIAKPCFLSILLSHESNGTVRSSQKAQEFDTCNDRDQLVCWRMK